MFRDTFLAGSGQKCLILPFVLAEAGQNRPENMTESGQYTAFLTLLSRKTCFWSPFAHLLSPETGSGGPTHQFEEKVFTLSTSLFVLFSRKGLFQIPH